MKIQLLTLLISSISLSVFAANDESEKKYYSPYVGNNYPNNVYFGDTHLHTSQSFDAITFGTSLGPENAYRFAQGEEVISSTGVPALPDAISNKK